MGESIGLLGGISIAPEDVAYGTKGTSWTFLHAISSTLGLRRSRIKSSGLGRGIRANGMYAPGFWDGEITLGLTFAESVIGGLLAAFGQTVTGTFTGGANAAPDEKAFSVRVQHGGTEYAYIGGVPTSLRLNLPHDAAPTMTVGLIGQSVAKEVSPSSVSAPSETLLLLPEDYDTLSVGGTSISHKGLTVELQQPHSGADRSVCGATWIREPIPTAPKMATFGFTNELDDSTGHNVVDLIDNYIAGTEEGAVLVQTDLLTLGGCAMIGDHPSMQAGIQDVPLNYEADSFAIELT